jgi:hypothetical protein
MSKKNIILTIVLILVVVGVAIWHKKTSNSNDYSVVYLTTGEVYVGKLTTFPDLELTDGYILEVTKDATDPTKSNFQLNPVNQALWAPKVLHLVEKNVIFYGPLLPTSKIAETLTAQGE